MAVEFSTGIADFGPDLSLRYDLLQPILERCSVDDLSRLEQTVPVRPFPFARLRITLTDM